jgi:hypothetical protein
MPQSVDVKGAAKHLKKMERIKKQIARVGLACSGTLYVRKKACGKPNCRCAKGPDQLHGPYYEWSRRREGKLVHSILGAEQATVLENAIASYREIQKLLGQWERETEAIILAGRKRKH